MGPGVRVGPLTAYRKPAAMPETTVTPDVHETLDVHGDLGAQSTLDLEGPFNLFSQKIDVLVAQILGTTRGIHSSSLNNLPGAGMPDSENVGQGYVDSLAPRKINTSNTCHQIVSVCL